MGVPSSPTGSRRKATLAKGTLWTFHDYTEQPEAFCNVTMGCRPRTKVLFMIQKCQFFGCFESQNLAEHCSHLQKHNCSESHAPCCSIVHLQAFPTGEIWTSLEVPMQLPYHRKTRLARRTPVHGPSTTTGITANILRCNTWAVGIALLEA